MKRFTIAVALLLSFGSNALAEDIYVKYRDGTVDVSNGHFQHLSLKDSRLVKNMYYDQGNSYLLVRLKSTYYHHCSIPQGVVSDWRDSSSLGKYYNRNIKGNYDCRINPIPSY